MNNNLNTQTTGYNKCMDDDYKPDDIHIQKRKRTYIDNNNDNKKLVTNNSNCASKIRIKLECGECVCVFSSNFEYETHFDSIHNDPYPYKCFYDKCNKSYMDKTGLEYHIKKHHLNCINYKCNICGKGFIVKRCFKQHCEYHQKFKQFEINKLNSGRYPFKCDYDTKCNKCYTTQFQLNCHIRKFHLQEINSICNICGKGFLQEYMMKAHRKLHLKISNKKKKTKRNVWKCSYCGKVFARNGNLKRHLCEIHGDETWKRFECKYCNKIFYSHCNYIFHVNVHTGDKPYSCNKCVKSFASRRYLNRHRLSVHSANN